MATHRCGAMMEAEAADFIGYTPFCRIEFESSGKQWRLYADYEAAPDVFIPIRFCPFCGEALDKEESHD